MKLVRWLVSVLLLAGLVYLSLTLPLGQKTLWQHLRAIAGSEESQELVEGVKQTAHQVTKPGADRPARPEAGAAPGNEDFSPAEREALRRLIKDKLAQRRDGTP